MKKKIADCIVLHRLVVGSQVGVEGQVTVGGQVGQVGGEGVGGQVTVGAHVGQVGATAVNNNSHEGQI